MARKGKKAEKREAAEEEKIGETRYSLAAGRTLEFRRCTAGCRCSNSPEGKIKTQYPRKDAKGQRGSEREGLGGRGLAGGRGRGRGSCARARSCVCTYQRKREKQRKRQRDSHAYLGTYRARRSSHLSAFPRRFSFRLFRCLSQRTVFHGPCLPRAAYGQRGFDRNACRGDSVLFVSLFTPGYGIRSRAFIFPRYSQAPRFSTFQQGRPTTAAMLDRAKS